MVITERLRKALSQIYVSHDYAWRYAPHGDVWLFIYSCGRNYKYVSENSTSEAEAREDFVHMEIPPPIALSDVPSPVG